MKKSAVETLVGLVVLCVAFGAAFVAYKSSDLMSLNESVYIVNAEFDKIDGISAGSVIKLSGIGVGKVVSTNLNANSYRANVVMQIQKNVKLPIDTSAEIIGLGFMGEKYITLTPGAENKYIGNNGMIDYTQSSVSLESLIGKFMFSGAESKDKQISSHDGGMQPESKIESPLHIPSVNEEIEAVNVPG